MGRAREDGWVSKQGGPGVLTERETRTSSSSLCFSPLGLNSSFSFCRKTRLLWSVSWRGVGGKSAFGDFGVTSAGAR